MGTWDRLWTKDEDERLLLLRGQGQEIAAIAERFPDRTFKAVRQRLQRLRDGIKETNRRPWSAGETAEIIRLREVEHRPWSEIDELMSRPRGSSASRYRDHSAAGRRQTAPRPAFVAPVLPAPKTITAWLCGDPLPGRSALDQRQMALPAARKPSLYTGDAR